MIKRDSLLPLETYARERNAFRARVIEHKKRRTVRLGSHVTLLFEDELTAASRPLSPPARRTMVRGIFSISQIARQLGVAVPAGGEIALTFSEINAAIR